MSSETVTQRDRDAVASFFRDPRTPLSVKFVLGQDPQPLLDAFARHRAPDAEPVAQAVEAVKNEIIREVCELPGDTPEDDPERIVCTVGELTTIIDAALAAMGERA